MPITEDSAISSQISANNIAATLGTIIYELEYLLPSKKGILQYFKEAHFKEAYDIDLKYVDTLHHEVKREHETCEERFRSITSYNSEILKNAMWNLEDQLRVHKHLFQYLTPDNLQDVQKVHYLVYALNWEIEYIEEVLTSHYINVCYIQKTSFLVCLFLHSGLS